MEFVEHRKLNASCLLVFCLAGSLSTCWFYLGWEFALWLRANIVLVNKFSQQLKY